MESTRHHPPKSVTSMQLADSRNQKRQRKRKRGYRKLLKKPLKGYRYRYKKFVAPNKRQDIEYCESDSGFPGFDVPPLARDCQVLIGTWATSNAGSLQRRDALRPIKVLSLFDGIGTGLLSLERLGIEVDTYFSCEIDEKALNVLHKNFHTKVVMLGSVTALTEQLLECLGRIDLLLGGSPCSDLSLVNWRRRGFHGEGSSAILFFEYVRVLQWLQAAAADRVTPFYHLFENTAAMENENEMLISETLKCQPILHDASKLVPMARRRLFWGNIPGLSADLSRRSPNALKLQQYLNPGRKAALDCLPTLTSCVSSQRWGSANRLPVIDQNGYGSFLQMNEMERIFGFPDDFTLCEKLSATDRRKLLGKSWCVPVIENILRPLSLLYKTNCS